MNLTTLLAIFAIGALLLGIFYRVEEYRLQDDPVLADLKNTVTPLFRRDQYFSGYLAPLNDTDIMERIVLYKGNKSYTINKQRIYLCLKDENGKYYQKNMLMYVLLHEIAHVICDEVGHTDKFQKIFDQLLYEATLATIYNPNIPIIQNYCSH